MIPALIAMGAVEALLIGLIVYQQWFHAKQTKDLVDRLMARDLNDYERAKKPTPPRIVIKKDEPVEDLGRILG